MKFFLSSLQAADWSIMHAIQDMFSCGPADRFFSLITHLGDIGLIWILIGVVLLFFRGSRKYGLLLLIALAIGAALGPGLIKAIVQRPRPFLQEPGVELLISAPKDTSFPSGHTLSSVSSAYIIGRANKGAGILAWVLAAVIAFSRMYVYVHFPSDVVCGALLGLTVGALVWKIGGMWAGRH